MEVQAGDADPDEEPDAHPVSFASQQHHVLSAPLPRATATWPLAATTTTAAGDAAAEPQQRRDSGAADEERAVSGSTPDLQRALMMTGAAVWGGGIDAPAGHGLRHMASVPVLGTQQVEQQPVRAAAPQRPQHAVAWQGSQPVMSAGQQRAMLAAVGSLPQHQHLHQQHPQPRMGAWGALRGAAGGGGLRSEAGHASGGAALHPPVHGMFASQPGAPSVPLAPTH